MSKLAHTNTGDVRLNYTFEELEAAIDMAPTSELDDINPDFDCVGEMMLSSKSVY